MPIQPVDQVADIARAYANLKQRLDRDSAEALGKKILALRDLLKKSLDDLNIWKNETDLDPTGLARWQTETSKWKLERLKKLEDRLTLEDATELSTFFKNVSNAVIDAQKGLNEFSKQYVKELEDEQSPIPPTYYSIPGIKAEMKLGVSEMTSKGINVILFKNQEQSTRYFESTVTFELVSSPPAPATRPKPVEVPHAEIAGSQTGATHLAVPAEPLEISERTLRAALAPSEQEETIDLLTQNLERAEATLLTVSDRIKEALHDETIQPKVRRATRKSKPPTKARKKTARKSRSTKK
jgi:hypothetical protein